MSAKGKGGTYGQPQSVRVTTEPCGQGQNIRVTTEHTDRRRTHPWGEQQGGTCKPGQRHNAGPGTYESAGQKARVSQAYKANAWAHSLAYKCKGLQLTSV